MTYSIVSERKVKSEVCIRTPSDAFPQLKRYAKSPQEQFIVITLNGAHEIIRVKVVSLGIINKTIVHPREVFRQAIIDNSAAIIVAHNHPSGNLDPSAEDLEVTTRLKDAGKLLGVPVLDHIIFSSKGFKSLLADNLFSF